MLFLHYKREYVGSMFVRVEVPAPPLYLEHRPLEIIRLKYWQLSHAFILFEGHLKEALPKGSAEGFQTP